MVEQLICNISFTSSCADKLEFVRFIFQLSNCFGSYIVPFDIEICTAVTTSNYKNKECFSFFSCLLYFQKFRENAWSKVKNIFLLFNWTKVTLVNFCQLGSNRDNLISLLVLVQIPQPIQTRFKFPNSPGEKKKPFSACFSSTRNWESALYQPTQWHNSILKLMTLMCDSGVVLKGEFRCWSLLEVKGLK